MTTPDTSTEATDTPLAGLRVLEFTEAIMGPSAGLADLGADVIKIEPALDTTLDAEGHSRHVQRSSSSSTGRIRSASPRARSPSTC